MIDLTAVAPNGDHADFWSAAATVTSAVLIGVVLQVNHMSRRILNFKRVERMLFALYLLTMLVGCAWIIGTALSSLSSGKSSQDSETVAKWILQLVVEFLLAEPLVVILGGAFSGYFAIVKDLHPFRRFRDSIRQRRTLASIAKSTKVLEEVQRRIESNDNGISDAESILQDLSAPEGRRVEAREYLVRARGYERETIAMLQPLARKLLGSVDEDLTADKLLCLLLDELKKGVEDLQKAYDRKTETEKRIRVVQLQLSDAKVAKDIANLNLPK